MKKTTQKPQITILGAGPIGLEAALYALHCDFPVRIIEQHLPAHHVQQWGFVRLFSPFQMNVTPLGSKVLTGQGYCLPPGEAYLTGQAFREAYLLPLAEWLAARVELLTRHRVIAVSREDVLKNEAIGQPRRQESPFRILVEDDQGRETILHSDIVIDATGSYSHPNWMGRGGIPARGERKWRPKIHYHLRDIGGRERERFAGSHVLVVGNGYSAATSVVSLVDLAAKVYWATRARGDQPIVPIANDPLKERRNLTEQANACLQHPAVRWLPGTSVEAVEFLPEENCFSVTLAGSQGQQRLQVDHILAQVGYSPDRTIYQELQIHECYASLGPMKLAAALLSEGSADCLTQSSKGPETLRNPEPNFFILGMKSYGRNSHFLLRVGFEQIRDLFQMITGEGQLNLYQQLRGKPILPGATLSESSK